MTMKAKNDKPKEKRLSLLFSAVDSQTAAPDREFLDMLRERSTAEFSVSSKTPEKAAIPISLWRIIIKSRVTRLAAAAMIVVAVLVSFGPLGIVGGSGVVWADVAHLMESMPAMVHQQSRIVTCDGQKISHLSSENVITHFLPDVGYREDMYDQQGQLMLRVYSLHPQKTSITVIPILRQYKIEMLSDDQLRAFNMGFVKIVECIKSGEYKKLGHKVINGTKTEGIEFTNPFLVIHTGYPLRFDELLFRMWVDVETSRPVTMEVEATASDKFFTIWTGGKPIHVQAVLDDIQWHAEIDPNVFRPDIPDDYTLMADEADSQDEDKAILGLKGFAEVTAGSYPNRLNMPCILIDGGEAILRRLGDDAWTGSRREQAEALWRRVIHGKATCLFYGELLRQGKDVAYFGDIVGAEDTGAVLMRWKISDDEYRVIFGDLTTQDVSTEQLAELKGASSGRKQ
jgi:hypothetical protein